MNRVDVILDLEPDYLMKYQNLAYKKQKNSHEKTIHLPDKIFDLAYQKGYIQKTNDGYIFVGTYNDLKALKKRK